MQPSQQRLGRFVGLQGSSLPGLGGAGSGFCSAVDRSIQSWQRQTEASQRLETIPGIGVITATAIQRS
jgi:hypothetical protein